MQGKANRFYQEDNVLIHTRILKAPRELVWEVWTKPEHIKEWWGPDGFIIKHKVMEVRAGKEWNFTMQGNGAEFDNSIKYIDVVRPSFLSYKHGDDSEDFSFTVFVTFEEFDNNTFLTIRSVFKSAEIIAELNKQVNAVEGGKQMLNKLETYITNQLNAN